MNKILFFAHLRDAIGEESIEMDANEKTVAELKQQIAENYKIQKLDTAMVAINEEFARTMKSFKKAISSHSSLRLVVVEMSDRYSRQILFSPIGIEGQDKIRSKHVLIIGAGALGSGNAEMLTRAGVGKLTIVDRDYVEESNLQRQQLYTERDVEQKLPKAAAAEKRLREINSDVHIEAVIGDANPEKLAELAQGKDLIIDSTDNFETRLAINDISQKLNIPWIYGACVGSYGMSFTIIPGKTPCLNCLLKTIPIQGMTCDTVGIISPAVGMVVAHQTAEALKVLVEDWECRSNLLCLL